MMLDIFLPEKLYGFRVLSKRILSISLSRDYTYSIQIYAIQGKTFIEQAYSEPIQAGEDKTFTQRATEAIKKLVSYSKNYDLVYIAVPASKVIFKEISLPLIDIEKIRMVVEYQVEDQLPFSLEEAIIDFIVTKQDAAASTSQILVAAIRNTDLQEILDIYSNAGITPNNISVDLFALYELYKMIPEYEGIQDGSSIINVGHNSTRITFIQNGELKLIRNAPLGLLTIATQISKESGINIEEVLTLLKSGSITDFADKKYKDIVQKNVIIYLNEIQFTLNAFSSKLGFYKEINQILFTTFDPIKSDFSKFASDALQIPCEIFKVEKIFTLNGIKNKVKQTINNWNNYALALGVALLAILPNEFNFRRKSFARPNLTLMKTQINFAMILIIGAFIGLSCFGYYQINGLNKQYQKLEQIEVAKLQTLLAFGQKTTTDMPTLRLIKKTIQETNLKRLLKNFNDIIKLEKAAWIDIYGLRINPIEHLFNLTQILDRKNFNVSINEILIDTENLTAKIDVSGTLESKTGEDWKDFLKFKLYVKEEGKKRNLILADDYDEKIIEGGTGVIFKLKFKVEEKST